MAQRLASSVREFTGTLHNQPFKQCFLGTKMICVRVRSSCLTDIEKRSNYEHIDNAGVQLDGRV